jgi:hypothetical protein
MNKSYDSNNVYDSSEFDDQESNDLVIETIDLKEPFDPKEIDIQVQQTTMSILIKRLYHNEIDLNPDFQRSPDLWKKNIQSRLIESLLIKLPIPAFYFDATDENKWQIIDGLQRLSTIKHFIIENELKLKDMEYLVELEGETFKELPRMLQRRVEEAPVTLYLIKPGTPPEVKYSLFYRINTGGLKLNPQEIRHALSQSVNNAQASKFLKKLSDLEIFKKCVRVSDTRMLDKELILRFLAFKMCHFNTYKEPMILFLNEIMKDLGEAKRVELDLLEKDFNRALALSWEIFGDDAFRKSILNKDKRGGVINRALFEVVTVVFSNLTEEGALDIKRNKEDFIKEYLKLLENNDFFESISISTTYAKNISYRFNAIINIVNIYLPEKEYQR